MKRVFYWPKKKNNRQIGGVEQNRDCRNKLMTCSKLIYEKTGKTIQWKK